LSRTNFTKETPINSDKLARICASIIADKKAEDIVAIDLRGLSSFTDFFIVCSGSSEPQLKAIANELEDRLKKEHRRCPLGTDGFPLSQWIVADYGDVVVHIFHRAKRDIYRLEYLWNDAPRLKLKPAPG
jgi:ribosome-associated protein